MSYRRCEAYFGHQEDRCWRVEGHRDEHRYAPLPDYAAEATAERDLVISVELGRLVVGDDVARDSNLFKKLEKSWEGG